MQMDSWPGKIVQARSSHELSGLLASWASLPGWDWWQWLWQKTGAFGEYPSLPRFSPTYWNIIPYPWLSPAGSFPNGGLRVTHSAAAFTTWDRASPPFVLCRWENDLLLMEEIRQTHPLRLVVPSLSQYLGRVFFFKRPKGGYFSPDFWLPSTVTVPTLTK